MLPPGFWLEVLGWSGSLLLVLSLLQSGMLRLRVINVIASTSLVLYNLLIPVWPMVAVNFAVVVINLFHIRKLIAARRAAPTPLA